jgi:putative membrane protein
MGRTLLLLLFCFGYSYIDQQAVQAHTGAPPAPHDIWQAWNWDRWLLLGLTLTALLYGRAVIILWRRAGVGRGVSWGQVWLFAMGMGTLFVALISPLDTLSTALFSAHMAQHLLLLYVAPLLLVLGAPPFLLLWAMPRPWRRPLMGWWQQSFWHRLWQWLLHPMAVWALFGLTLWLWHIPLFYQAAVVNRTIHMVEHGAFFGTALLFCWLLVDGRQARTKAAANEGLILLVIFTTALHSGLLGALLTFAATPFYPIYRFGVAQWGLTLLEDQQIAGVLMWIPAGFFYLGAMLVLVERRLNHLEATPATNHSIKETSYG